MSAHLSGQMDIYLNLIGENEHTIVDFVLCRPPMVTNVMVREDRYSVLVGSLFLLLLVAFNMMLMIYTYPSRSMQCWYPNYSVSNVLSTPLIGSDPGPADEKSSTCVGIEKMSRLCHRSISEPSTEKKVGLTKHFRP